MSTRLYPGDISRYGLPFKIKLEDSGTSSVTTANGRKNFIVKTATAVPYGDWGRVLVPCLYLSLRGAAGRLFEPRSCGLHVHKLSRLGILRIGHAGPSGRFPGDRVIQGARNPLANPSPDIDECSHSKTWQCLEKSFSYSNARLSQALPILGWHSSNQRMVEGGKHFSLVACRRTAPADKQIVPIGSMGFVAEGSKTASLCTTTQATSSSCLAGLPANKT